MNHYPASGLRWWSVGVPGKGFVGFEVREGGGVSRTVNLSLPMPDDMPARRPFQRPVILPARRTSGWEVGLVVPGTG